MKTPRQFKLIGSNSARIRKLLVELILLGATWGAYAQGLVNFINTPQTLISANLSWGGSAVINPPVGSYYFGLLIAPPGATDFTFTGVYATNQFTPGMISGGTNVPVLGWEPGTARAFIVCGWGASAGPTFNPSWLVGHGPPFGLEFGMSRTAIGVAGGVDSQTGENLPALNIFSSETIWEGFTIVANLCLSCNPPEIWIQPQDQSTTVGMAVSFSVGVSLTPDLMFQWYCNGAVIAGATNSVLELTNVSLSQNGNRYYAIAENPWGSITSVTATLTVAPMLPVAVRWVPGLRLSGQQGTLLVIANSDALGSSSSWSNLQNVVLATNRNWWFDLSGFSNQRFYRTLQSSSTGTSPILELDMVPSITLTGAVGTHVLIDYINQVGPSNVWAPLANVLLTNSPQLYFDISAIGQPPRFYNLIPR